MIDEIIKGDFLPRLFPHASRSIHEFAEQEVIVPKGPRRGTYFDCQFAPCMNFVFDAIMDKRWRKVAVVGPTQSGKSLVCNNIPMLYTLFELQEDIIVGIPDMELARGIWMEKIKPVICSTRFEALLPTKGAGARGGVPVAIELGNGAFLRFMGAGGGDAQRSSHTARIVIMTEVDKMDDIGEASEEADPVSQIEMRADAYGDTSKILLECTPSSEGGRIWQEVTVLGTGSRPWVPCPHCGRYQALEKKGLVYDSEDALTAEETARYKCAHCESLWTDHERRVALKTPLLVHKTQEVDETGTVIGDEPRTKTFGFHFNVLYSPMQSIGKTAAQQWEADASEYKEKKKAMVQSKWAMPWSEDTGPDLTCSFSFLNTRAKGSQTRMGKVPEWADYILMEVDVQKRWLYWHCEAYKHDGTSKVIEYGITDIVDESDRAIVKALDQTNDIAMEGWQIENDQETLVQPRLCMLDTGYRYDVLAGWLKHHTGWVGVKGTGRGNRVRMTGKKAIFSIPGILTVRPQDDGNRIWFIDVDATKSIVHDRYFLGDEQPGYTDIPADVTRGYLMSITAEQRVPDPKGDGFVWEKVRRRNDYLDCRSYGVAAQMYLAEKAKKDGDRVEARVKHNIRREKGGDKVDTRKSFLAPETKKGPRRQIQQNNWLNSTGRYF